MNGLSVCPEQLDSGSQRQVDGDTQSHMGFRPEYWIVDLNDPIFFHEYDLELELPFSYAYEPTIREFRCC